MTCACQRHLAHGASHCLRPVGSRDCGTVVAHPPVPFSTARRHPDVVFAAPHGEKAAATREGGSGLCLFFDIRWGNGQLESIPPQARIYAPSALHRIIIRGIELRRIFDDDKDREDGGYPVS